MNSERLKEERGGGPDNRSDLTLQLLRAPFPSTYPRELSFSRSREYYLYTSNRKRYLDCILAGGAALLGHNPAGLSQALKNRISSGPMVPSRTRDEARLRQAVRRLFPSVATVAAVDLKRVGIDNFESLSGNDGKPLPLWRPFETEIPLKGVAPGEPEIAGRPWPQPPASEFLLVPSFPLDPDLIVYCGVGGPGQDAWVPGADAWEPGEDAWVPGHISPVLLAGLTKAVHLLASAYEGRPLPRKLSRAETSGWSEPLFTGSVWQRRGVYYGYVGPPQAYGHLKESLMERGILIPTDPRRPVICPRIVTARERSRWGEICDTL